MFIFVAVTAYVLSIAFDIKRSTWWSSLPTALSLTYAIVSEANLEGRWIPLSIFLNLFLGGLVFGFIVKRGIARYQKYLELMEFFDWMERNLNEGIERKYDEAHFRNNTNNIVVMLNEKYEGKTSRRQARLIKKLIEDLRNTISHKHGMKIFLKFRSNYTKGLLPWLF